MATVDTPRTPRPSVPPTSAPFSARSTEALRPPPSVRIGESSFVSDATLDGWTRSGAATRAGSLLTTPDGRCFSLRDAVRVLGRRNSDTDPYGLTGRIESLRDFIRRGATLSTDTLRLGPAVYDVEHGVLAVPR